MINIWSDWYDHLCVLKCHSVPCKYINYYVLIKIFIFKKIIINHVSTAATALPQPPKLDCQGGGVLCHTHMEAPFSPHWGVGFGFAGLRSPEKAFITDKQLLNPDFRAWSIQWLFSWGTLWLCDIPIVKCCHCPDDRPVMPNATKLAWTRQSKLSNGLWKSLCSSLPRTSLCFLLPPNWRTGAQSSFRICEGWAARPALPPTLKYVMLELFV